MCVCVCSYKVNPDTPAYAHGLNAGDQVLSINGRNVTHMSHQEAKMEITRSGNELELTVIRYKNSNEFIHFRFVLLVEECLLNSQCQCHDLCLN